MAVIQTGGGGGFLGALGKIAGLGGMLVPGAQWLTPLGIGLGAADSVANGNPQGALTQLFSGIASGGFDSWTNPAAGNLAVNQPAWNQVYQDLRRRNGWGGW